MPILAKGPADRARGALIRSSRVWTLAEMSFCDIIMSIVFPGIRRMAENTITLANRNVGTRATRRRIRYLSMTRSIGGALTMQIGGPTAPRSCPSLCEKAAERPLIKNEVSSLFADQLQSAHPIWSYHSSVLLAAVSRRMLSRWRSSGVLIYSENH